MSKISEIIKNLVEPIASSFGLEVVEVEYSKKFNGMNLTIFIDKEGGVKIDDCEKLHRAIDKPIDDLDPIENAYILNVSSLGIDRPLKTERDFKRNLNKKIHVKLYQSVDKKKEFSGELTNFDSTTFTLTDKDGKATVFEIAKTALIEPLIEF